MDSDIFFLFVLHGAENVFRMFIIVVTTICFFLCMLEGFCGYQGLRSF